MTPEQKTRLSEALRRKWASGTRKPTPKYAYEKASLTHKKQIKAGRKKYSFTSETAKEAVKLVDKEKQKEINRRIVKETRLGIPMPHGPGAKGPDHWKSKYWILISPDKKRIEGWNLNEIVRNNAELFDESDLVWVRSRCRASKGLRSLFEMKKDRRGNRVPTATWWKGWTIGDRLEDEP